MADSLLRLPRNLYLADQVRQLDALAIEQLAIPGLSLMQAAGSAAFHLLRDTWPRTQSVWVFTGAGNNGGDGYVLASLAAEAGWQVTIVTVGDPDRLRADAATVAELARLTKATFIDLRTFSSQDLSPRQTVLVDALLGTGLDRCLGGDYAEAVRLINGLSVPVLSIDIPSGLQADTGQALGDAVHADVTITFIAMKLGLLTGQARAYVGNLVYHDLDLPQSLFTSPAAPRPVATRIDCQYAAARLPQRPADAHKGHFGHVVIVGGDFGYGGATLLAAEAAARSGAGLVSVVTRSCHRPAVLARRPELMVAGTEDAAPSAAEVDPVTSVAAVLERATVVVIGPGLGRGVWGRALLRQVLALHRTSSVPLVVDADALHLLAEESESLQVPGSRRWILTPHPGEAAALLGISTAEIQADRLAAVRELVIRWGGSCLLKGSGSLIAGSEAGQPVYLSTEGNPGMATGGMGDVLSGLVAGLVAQGLALTEALCCAVCLHGEAADLAAAEGGERGLLASDLFSQLRPLLNPPATP